jgi:dTDP-4-amino-4,6-dideoxygalactose transaminase
MKNKHKIFVTQPYLPPLEEFIPYLEKIWSNKILTNGGEFHQLFEKELAEYLGVKYLSLFTNGTLALVTALQALRITGEVITTPFSFVATTHSLWWNNIKPVFVDIEPETYNLDPKKIESAITPRTTAILPVHVYGNPCNVCEIKEIADKFGLKIIYDACHAFGVKIYGESILNFGDLSVLSFHATKAFNTFEGGAIVCHDIETKQRIDYLKNFGFADETTIVIPGINAKMSEFNAALGLLQLKYVDKSIDKRKQIAEYYREKLKNIKGIKILNDIKGIRHTYTYFPILIEKDFPFTRDEVYEKLKEYNIFTRRYFYPLISKFPAYRNLESSKEYNLRTANIIAIKVLCLPIYPDLIFNDMKNICELFIRFIENC